MAIQAMALGGNTPQINALGAFTEGQQAKQTFDANNIALAQKGLETIGSIALGAMGGKLDGEADPQMFEQGLDYLAQNGINVEGFRGRPDLAPVVARSSMTALQQLQLAQNQQEYDLAMKKFEQDVITAAKAPKASLNLSYGKDAAGNVVPLQTREDGTMIQSQLPDGVTLATKGDKIDLGTEWGILDPLTRQVVERVPKANYEEAYDKAAGGEAGKTETATALELPAKKAAAEGALTSFERKADFMSGTLDKAISSIEGNPNLLTGIGGEWTKVVPGSPAYDLAQTLLTIQANIGFDALQKMREASPTGGALGAISDTENRLLQAVEGATAQGQSAPQLLENLRQIKTLSQQVLAERKQAFGRDFGGDKSGTAESPLPKPPSSIDYNADTAPEGWGAGDPQVTPEMWKFMSPEDRALW